MSVKVLHTALGGRNGHTQSANNLVSPDLSVPKAMGGPGEPNTGTPEDLFAAGCVARFGGAREFIGRQMKLIPTSVEVTASVGIAVATA